MNMEDIRAAWLRYMHRADLSADLDTTEAMAREKIGTRMMRTDELPEPEASPRLWLHAGLSYLHELSQDDEGLAREQNLFEQAAVDHQFRWSLDNVTPSMRAS